MNSEQASNVLDAYVLLSTTNAKAASDSLREVILDAMTTTYYPISISQEPYKPTITWKNEVETGQMEVTR